MQIYLGPVLTQYINSKTQEQLLGKSIAQYVKHLNNVLQIAQGCVMCRGRLRRFPFVLNVSGSRFRASSGSKDVGIL